VDQIGTIAGQATTVSQGLTRARWLVTVCWWARATVFGSCGPGLGSEGGEMRMQVSWLGPLPEPVQSAAVATAQGREVRLEDRYTLERGTVFLTGIQALVRLPIEQARRDRAAGLRTGILISGYPGSPLGGYDLELARAQRFLEPLDIHHVPGLNEELAAASVWGSQMIERFGHSRFDGVTGIWYGKSPGVDRTLDVFRHANFGGGPSNSGMLALAGDDPNAKSSTLPNASEWDFVACSMPVLYPATVGELLSLGLHGIALSRLVGLWTALKCVTNLCDGGASVRLAPDQPRIVLPELGDFEKPQSFSLLAPASIELERHLFERRIPAVHVYARANRLDEIVWRGPRDRVGLVAAGKTATDLRQALLDLGLGEAELAALGIRVLQIRLLYPLDPAIVREFAEGLEEIVVVEEKRDLIEGQLRAILYPGPHRPLVVGKTDERGRPLFPWHGELDQDAIAERVGPRLLRLGPVPEQLRRRLREIEEIRGRRYTTFAQRLPNYCSGCPHNRSTVAVEGEVVGGGIGCHGMGALMTQPERGFAFATPMGAEGAPWIGAAPFVDLDHVVQNVGDGTFFHSASQSLRACVAAGVNITFKLLYNRHIAMTGGQRPQGAFDIITLTRYLRAEGVARTIVVSERPSEYRGSELADNAAVYDRSRYGEAVRELRRVPGVTVLIFDQECAAEKRRARKRGRSPMPSQYIFINEEVCEGCGDCGRISNCMSVQPVETEFGRKTQVHQSSCNQDYSCLQGDCPAFLTVTTSEGLAPRHPPPLAPDELPEPGGRVEARHGYRIYLPGIGGTGVVTTNQVLAYAALIEGKQVSILDQTGLAQKGGAVLSSLLVHEGEENPSLANRVGLGGADLVLGLDLLGVANPINADRMSPERTVVVANSSVVPTAEAIRHVGFLMPAESMLRHAVDRYSRASENVYVDAGGMAEVLFGDQMMANLLVVGAAYQAGLLPMSAASIEAAIQLNGVDVERNLQAFRYGRLSVHDAERVQRLTRPHVPTLEEVRQRQLAQLNGRGARYLELLERCAGMSEETRRLLALRVGELIRYQGPAYAAGYVDDVVAIWEREQGVAPGREELTQAVARFLYKLLAYKDEYEVARLLLKEEWAERVRQTFVRPRVAFNLHPPLLREWGLRRKLRFGPWFRPVLWMLTHLRWLRGTSWDPFGRTRMRRLERELIGWYRGVLAELREGLTADNHDQAVEIASIPDHIRGYEGLKLANAERARRLAGERLERFRASEASRA
jgi:indolepyruvate ferredoxin oxidoreductase